MGVDADNCVSKVVERDSDDVAYDAVEIMAWLATAEHGDHEAAHKLVNSHLRLVAKIAMGYRGYGLPISEVISEGNVGLMQAIKRFEPDKGFRLATYATWWI